MPSNLQCVYVKHLGEWIYYTSGEEGRCKFTVFQIHAVKTEGAEPTLTLSCELLGAGRRHTKGDRSWHPDLHHDTVLTGTTLPSVSWCLLALDQVLFCCLMFGGHWALCFTPVRLTVITGQCED